MEKRLRSLESSARDFILSATKLSLKSCKPSLKTLIHGVKSSSDLPSSLPSSLHSTISEAVQSFKNLVDSHFANNNPYRNPSPSNSPPTKRLRRSSRHSKTMVEADSGINGRNPRDEKQQILEKLEVLSYIVLLCVSHPKKVFPAADLLPCARGLHDNLILFESDSVLLSEISCLCEEWWKEDLPERESLISQFLPFLLSRSLAQKKKVDLHRVYSLREAFSLFDFEDESIEDLKLLLNRCVIEPLYLKTEDGRRFVAFMFGLSKQLQREALAMIRAQIPFGRKSMLEAYGDILFRAWKVAEGDSRDEIENGFLQGLVEGAIHASSAAFAASIRRVLGGFINQRINRDVEKLIFRLAEPVIFRSLQVANSNVRQNALHLLLDMFPLEDPDATKEVKDTLLNKQFFLIEKLLMDDCPDVRVVAVEGCCRILHLFWEIIPSPIITKIITKTLDDMSRDVSKEIRLSTVNGIIYLVGNPRSHEILRVLLPRLSHLMLDSVLSVRVAIVDLLLLLIRDVRNFQFHKVVGFDVLLDALANDQPPVSQKITRLLMPSYFPSKASVAEACNRCCTLIKRSPLAGARFCKFLQVEGASLTSLMELVRVFIDFVLSPGKKPDIHIEGLLVASEYLCNDLVREPCHKDGLKELFPGQKLKRLFATAATGCAKSSIFNIVSIVSPDDVAGLLEDSVNLITCCSGLSADIERQAEVRSAHKLLLSCGGSDDMFRALTVLLHKTAYRCHAKFGIKMPKLSLHSLKRKNCKSVGKFSSKSKRKKPSDFEEDYLVAVAVSWQINDLLTCEDARRKALLGSQTLESLFLALKVICEASIEQCVHFGYMTDPSPVFAYTALALHITLQNVRLSITKTCSTDQNNSECSLSLKTVLEQTADHVLNSAEKLFVSDDPEERGNISSQPEQCNKKSPQCHGETWRESRINSSLPSAGSVDTEPNMLSNKLKMLTAVLKFIVDATTMDAVSQHLKQSLKFASAYMNHIMCTLALHSSPEFSFKEDEVKDLILYLKSSFTYAAKLLNQTLKHATDEASPPPIEAFRLSNDLFDLITSVELHLGSHHSALLLTTAKPWLPDLILGLGIRQILNRVRGEETQLALFDTMKLFLPLWLSRVAKVELLTISEASFEENDQVSKPDKYPTFNNLLRIMVALVKGDRNILDAIGAFFLMGSLVGLERKEFSLVLGLVHFVCLKLLSEGDKEWGNLMLSVLQEIYPEIERELGEAEGEDNEEGAMKQLLDVRQLLEPVWMYHVCETGKVSTMEE